MLKLYADGGVIRQNPSPFGGTWAICMVNHLDQLVWKNSGIISPEDMETPFVTNNQTELLAVIYGLQRVMTSENDLEVCSDSQITLMRVFGHSPFNNIPEWMINLLRWEQKRLTYFKKFTHTLMDGHPTKAQVESGIGKKGHVTSKWNVLCDKLCNEQAEKFLNSITPKLAYTVNDSKS